MDVSSLGRLPEWSECLLGGEWVRILDRSWTRGRVLVESLTDGSQHAASPDCLVAVIV